MHFVFPAVHPQLFYILCAGVMAQPVYTMLCLCAFSRVVCNWLLGECTAIAAIIILAVEV